MATTPDQAIVSAINRRTGAGLSVVGRALHGSLGGAIYAEWPDGRPAVVTRFLGSLAPDTLRTYWAHWLLRRLGRVVRSAPSDVVDWHLDMAESRLM